MASPESLWLPGEDVHVSVTPMCELTVMGCLKDPFTGHSFLFGDLFHEFLGHPIIKTLMWGVKYSLS